MPIPTYTDMKLAEMLMPSAPPKPPTGTLGAAATDPVFKDANGNTITSIRCGQSYTFDVPGYTQVWLTLFRNGTKVFDGQMAVGASNPNYPYTSNCTDNVGSYQAIAYDLNTGMVIGTANFTILNADGSGGPSTGGLASIPTPVLVGGAVVLFLMMKKGRK